VRSQLSDRHCYRLSKRIHRQAFQWPCLIRKRRFNGSRAPIRVLIFRPFPMPRIRLLPLPMPPMVNPATVSGDSHRFGCSCGCCSVTSAPATLHVQNSITNGTVKWKYNTALQPQPIHGSWPPSRPMQQSLTHHPPSGRWNHLHQLHGLFQLR